MKKRLSPIEIALRELPLEGREYQYNHDSGELTPILKDLIGTGAYSVSLQVRPIGNAFEVQGDVKTMLPLQCSLCAINFQFPVIEKFHEVLVIQEPLHKGDQNTKTNHSSEWDSGQPEGIYLESDVFRVDEFVHELIGIAEPIRPLGKPDCDKYCENLQALPERDWLSLGANDSISIKNHPFSVLEKLKLKR